MRQGQGSFQPANKDQSGHDRSGSGSSSEVRFSSGPVWSDMTVSRSTNARRLFMHLHPFGSILGLEAVMAVIFSV